MTAREALLKADALLRLQQDVVRRYLPPDSGITPQEALNELIELVDGPEQREVQAAVAEAVSIARKPH